MLASGHIFAAPTCQTHFQMQVNSESDSGIWETYAHYSSETGTAVLPAQNCQQITWFEHPDPSAPDTYTQLQKPQWVGKSKPVTIGHQNTPGGDFFGTLTITMTWQPDNEKPTKEYHPYLNNRELKRSVSGDPVPPAKTCVFFVAASGPAQPVTDSYGYHGAKCDWKIDNGFYQFSAQ